MAIEISKRLKEAIEKTRKLLEAQTKAKESAGKVKIPPPPKV